MINHKLMAAIAVATLAVTPGLVACGNQSQSELTKATQSQVAGDAAKGVDAQSSDAGAQNADVVEGQGNVISVGAKGMTNDGAYDVIYRETHDFDGGNVYGVLVVRDTSTGSSTVWQGDIEVDGANYTLKDATTGEVVTYEIPDIDPDSGSVNDFVMRIDGRGDFTLSFVADSDELDSEIDEVLAKDAKVVKDIESEIVDGSGKGAGASGSASDVSASVSEGASAVSK